MSATAGERGGRANGFFPSFFSFFEGYGGFGEFRIDTFQFGFRFIESILFLIISLSPSTKKGRSKLTTAPAADGNDQ
jgi:hypothetical protein